MHLSVLKFFSRDFRSFISSTICLGKSCLRSGGGFLFPTASVSPFRRTDVRPCERFSTPGPMLEALRLMISLLTTFLKLDMSVSSVKFQPGLGECLCLVNEENLSVRVRKRQLWSESPPQAPPSSISIFLTVDRCSADITE